MGVGSGLYMHDVVVKRSRSLSHLLMSSCIITAWRYAIAVSAVVACPSVYPSDTSQHLRIKTAKRRIRHTKPYNRRVLSFHKPKIAAKCQQGHPQRVHQVEQK